MNAALLTDCGLQLCSAAIEVDPLPPERVLSMGTDPAAAFIAPDGQAWVGLGVARWQAPGQDDTAALFAGLLDDSSDTPAPAALGALPFRADESPDALWQGLVPGGLMLPERLYVQQGGRAWWRLTLPLHDVGALQSRLAQGRKALASLAHTEAQPVPPWPAVEALFAGLPGVLADGAKLVIYGPFNYDGCFTSESNAKFDAGLKLDRPERGIRDFEAVDALAQAIGMRLVEDAEMPVNNRCLSWRLA